MREHHRRPLVRVHQVARGVRANAAGDRAGAEAFLVLRSCFVMSWLTFAAPCAAAVRAMTGTCTAARACRAASRRWPRPATPSAACRPRCAPRATPPESARLHASSFRIIPPETLFWRIRSSISSPRNRLQHFRAVQHAGHVGQINQPVGVNVFRARGRHVVGIDVVELAVRAQTQARRHRHDSRAPERFAEIPDSLRSDSRQIPARPALRSPASARPESSRIGRAQCRRPAGPPAKSRPARRLFSRPPRTITATSRVSRSVTRSPLTNRLSIPMRSQRGGKNLSAAVHHQQFVALRAQAARSAAPGFAPPPRHRATLPQL